MLEFPTEQEVQSLIYSLVMTFFSNITYGLLVVFVFSFAIVYIFRNLSLWEELTNVLLSFSGEITNERQRRIFELSIKIIGPPFSLGVLYLISVAALASFGIIVPEL